MTIERFRSSSEFTAKIREILAEPIMQEGLMALLDSNRPSDPMDSEDAIASVRRHSRGVGYNNAIRDLLSLGEPILSAELPNDPPFYGAEMETVSPEPKP